MSAKFQCPYCGVGCGLLMGEGRVRGDKDHPANFGDVCKKPLYYPKVMNKGDFLNLCIEKIKKSPL
jgi:ferredoxin-nitrate reductase